MPITETVPDGKDDECFVQQSPLLTHDGKGLEVVHNDYYKLYPVTSECKLSEFTATIPGLTNRCKLGYGFYEFTSSEYISFDKQVILMGKV